MTITQALNSWHRRDFNYGDADCCQFANFIVKQMTGKDFATDFNYQSESQAYEIVEQEGKLVDFLQTVLGNPSTELKDGDPCVVDLPIIGQVCGVKYKSNVVCLTDKGLTQIKDRYLLLGWSV